MSHQNIVIIATRRPAETVVGGPHHDPVAVVVGGDLREPVIAQIIHGVGVQRYGVGPGVPIVHAQREEDVLVVVIRPLGRVPYNPCCDPVACSVGRQVRMSVPAVVEWSVVVQRSRGCPGQAVVGAA